MLDIAIFSIFRATRGEAEGHFCSYLVFPPVLSSDGLPLSFPGKETLHLMGKDSLRENIKSFLLIPIRISKDEWLCRKPGAISFGILPENEVVNIVNPGLKVKGAEGNLKRNRPCANLKI
jgi:hypothetical protein